MKVFFQGGRVAGFVDSWPTTLVSSASNRSTPEWTLVDSRQGESTKSNFALGDGDRPLDQLAQVGRGQPVEMGEHVGVAAIVVGDEEGVGIGLQEVVARGVPDLQHQRRAVLM